MSDFEDFDFGQSADTWAPSGGGSNLITYIKEPVTQLRFVHDRWSEFTIAYMHRDDENKVSFPCPGGDNRSKCPGCINNMKASAKLFGVAMDRKTNYVNVYQIPISLKEDLARMMDRDGAMNKRDVTIYKSGQKLDTTYGLEKEDRSELPEFPEEIPTIREALLEAWKYGTNAEYREGKRQEAAGRKSESEGTLENIKQEDDKPPFDEAPVEEDLPRGEITEAEIRAMSFMALIQLAASNGIEVNEDLSKQQVADQIIEKLS